MRAAETEKISEILETVKRRVQFSAIKKVGIKEPEKLFLALKSEHPGVQVQILDAHRVAGSRHLTYACANALAAFKGHYNLSKNIAVEFLLFASARRQINEAIRCVGVRPGTKNIVVVTFDCDNREHTKIVRQVVDTIGGTVNNQTLEKMTRDKLQELKRIFQVARIELKASSTAKSDTAFAVENLILERMAILAATR